MLDNLQIHANVIKTPDQGKMSWIWLASQLEKTQIDRSFFVFFCWYYFMSITCAFVVLAQNKKPRFPTDTIRNTKRAGQDQAYGQVSILTWQDKPTYLHITSSAPKLFSQDSQRIDQPDRNRGIPTDLGECLLDPDAVEALDVVARPDPTVQNAEYLIGYFFERGHPQDRIPGDPLLATRSCPNGRDIPRPDESAVTL